MNSISLQAGGVLIKGQTVLLAKIEYGANSGKWMLPGGLLEHGESIEEAACREFFEETGIVTTTNRMVGMRSGTREVEGNVQTTIYIVFEMIYKSGELKKDEMEISDLKYWTIQEIEDSNEIIELSKEIALKTFHTRNGLYKGKDIQVNNSYKSYAFYLPNE